VKYPQDSVPESEQREHSSVSSRSSEGPVVASDGYLDPRQVHEPIYHDLVFPPKPNQVELRSFNPLATYANETKGIFIQKSRDL
jgi:hypothetical protein